MPWTPTPTRPAAPALLDDSVTVPIRTGPIPTVAIPTIVIPTVVIPTSPVPPPAPVAVAPGPSGSPLVAPRRVTVVTGTARLDIALPAQCTIAELLPALVGMTGATADPAATGVGWCLRRLGGAVLPAERTVAAADLRDGEILHLVAGGDPGDAAVFDDLVDALASAVQECPGRWSAAVSRRIAAGVATVGFAVAAAGLAFAAPVVGAALALVLLLAGGALSRSGGDARIGAAVAAGGLPGALVAGATFVAPPGVELPGPAQVAVGLAAAACYAVLAAVLVVDQVAWFSAVAGAAAVGGAVAVTVLLAGYRPVSGATVALVVAVAASPSFPQLALRLARLPLPRIPADIAAFRAGEEPTTGARVADRARVAETALTALLAALTAIVAGCGLVLLRADEPWAWLLVGLCAPAMLLRSRAYLSVGQRCAVLLAAALALAGVGGRLAVAYGGQVRPGLLAVALVVAVGGVVHAMRVGLRSPYWSRLLDVLEFCCLAALLPVALAVLGVYGTVRGLGG